MANQTGVEQLEGKVLSWNSLKANRSFNSTCFCLQSHHSL